MTKPAQRGGQSRRGGQSGTGRTTAAATGIVSETGAVRATGTEKGVASASGAATVIGAAIRTEIAIGTGSATSGSGTNRTTGMRLSLATLDLIALRLFPGRLTGRASTPCMAYGWPRVLSPKQNVTATVP